MITVLQYSNNTGAGRGVMFVTVAVALDVYITFFQVGIGAYFLGVFQSTVLGDISGHWAHETIVRPVVSLQCHR